MTRIPGQDRPRAEPSLQQSMYLLAEGRLIFILSSLPGLDLLFSSKKALLRAAVKWMLQCDIEVVTHVLTETDRRFTIVSSLRLTSGLASPRDRWLEA